MLFGGLVSKDSELGNSVLAVLSIGNLGFRVKRSPLTLLTL